MALAVKAPRELKKPAAAPRVGVVTKAGSSGGRNGVQV
jgi:hypothetical protein